MAKIIKLTYRQLREAEVSDFTYLDTDNDKASCDGKSQISVDGKIDNDTVGDTTTNDKIASVLTPQSYNRFHSYILLRHSTTHGMKHPDTTYI